MRRIFVISDLHLGGLPDVVDTEGKTVEYGFQICRAHKELTAFVHWVKSQGLKDRPTDLELVINGDLVDFLADDDLDDSSLRAQVWTADEAKAIQKLDRIIKRSRNEPSTGIFDALQDFLAAGHRLTLLLGNHDVELALPAVRTHLINLLNGSGKLLTFIHDGEAYTVGGVLFEHGNRYDRWNQINYSTLRQERSMLSRGLQVKEEHRKDRYFVVPAGTYLVIHFMNRIKSRYRFIDLLKPETNAVIPLLLALEPAYRPLLSEILAVGPIASRLRRAGLKESTIPNAAGDMALYIGGDDCALSAPIADFNFLEDFVPESHVTLDQILDETLGSDARLFSNQSGPGQDLNLVERAKQTIAWLSGKAEQLEETVESLSQVLAIRESFDDEERLQQLHVALRRLNLYDRNFDVTHEQPEYLQAATDTAEAGKFDLVAYGHTHLPKKVSLRPNDCGPPWYLNSGTWCDVIRLPSPILDDYRAAKPELQKFVAAMRDNEIAPYVRRYLSFLEIEVDPEKRSGSVSKAELYSYRGEGRERSPHLTTFS